MVSIQRDIFIHELPIMYTNSKRLDMASNKLPQLGMGDSRYLLLFNSYVFLVMDMTMFVNKENGNIMIDTIYVNDIMFGGISSKMVDHFVQKM